jgi:O-antigen/teichoic acid export membrane protein
MIQRPTFYYIATSGIIASQPLLAGPIIVSSIGLEQYSVTQIFQTYATAIIIFTNLGATAAIPKHYKKGWPFKKVLNNLIILNIALWVVGILIYYVYNSLYTIALPVKINVRTLITLSAFSLLNVLYTSLILFMQLQNKPKLIFHSALIVLILFSGIFILMLLYSEITVHTRLDAATTGYLGSIIYLLCKSDKEVRAEQYYFDSVFIRSALKYFPPVLGVFLLQNFDRLYLPAHVSLERLGILNLSLQVGFGVLMISDALNKQRFADIQNSNTVTRSAIMKDIKKSIARSAFVILTISMLSTMYFLILFDQKYYEAMMLSLFIIISLGVTPVFHCFQNYLYYYDKPKLMTICSITALVVYILTVVNFTEDYSIYSVVLALMLYNLTRVVMSAYFVKISWNSNV